MTTTPRPRYTCGIDAAMDVIGGKWKVLILWALDERPHRFGELRRALPGVSEKVLASHLRELEADRIVRREVRDEVPPHVSYSLTPLGRSLNEALGPLGAWGREHVLGGATHRAAPAGDAAGGGAAGGQPATGVTQREAATQ
ncbi:winged helix-turn-helix transcriptional regulator [Streptomyces triticirhizae]|uniref:Transcriptional regulator n=1 Tax=Streptomyces triticirhizae TaxID=2483353 RepID=A0A3M2M7S3_9ACTN|nr:helix-turn-helix domain-containing protein [Streptomyces triticirhizae]RMI45656.1 transcriptional regulator [Streptomyces triticirhizae]